MDQSTGFSRTLRYLIGAASLGISMLVLQQFAGFANIILIAVILAILFSPVMNWFIRKNLPNFAAFLLTMLIVIMIIGGLILFLAYSLSLLSSAIPTYAKELEVLILNVQTFFASYGVNKDETMAIVDVVDPFEILGIVTNVLSGLLGGLSDAVFVILALAFLLIASPGMADKAERIFGKGNPAIARWTHYSQDIRHYIIITNNVGMLVGAFNAIMLSLIGVDFAILWGVLSWMLSFIPMIGFFIALIPPVILGLLEFGWPTAVFILVAYIVINSIVDDVLKPKIMGEGLDLAPVMVLFSVLFWGLILGPIGGILAVPVTLGIKQLILDADPDSRWMAELISNSKSVESEVEP